MSEVAAPETLWLPPRQLQLRDPAKWEDMILPEEYTDDRGLIVPSQLIEVVKGSVDPTYEWPDGLSIHHLYWPASWYSYEDTPDCRRSSGTFRQLPIHKALLPRVFENWLHAITVPPNVPEPDVIQFRIDAWNVAKDLFQTARETIAHEKLARRRRAYVATNPHVLKTDFNGFDKIGEEYIQEEYERNFRGWDQILERYEEIPEEFRLIEIDQPIDVIAKSLGKLVAPKSLVLTRAASCN